MKQRSIEIAVFALFLLPLLLILGNPTLISYALDLERPAVRSASAPYQQSFYAMGGLYDGWVLESGEFTGIGGSMNTVNTSIALGDDARDRQYRGILTFDTEWLPTNAYILSATLSLTSNGVIGINPFGFGDLRTDIKQGVFGGSKYLQLADFQAPASFNNVSNQPTCPITGKCIIHLPYAAFAYLNPYGFTQFRLHFVPDDNDNMKADYYRMFSGDVGTYANKPVLVVRYYP